MASWVLVSLQLAESHSPPVGTSGRCHKILTGVCDRKRLERDIAYFWWHAGLGSASGTLVFFFKV